MASNNTHKELTYNLDDVECSYCHKPFKMIFKRCHVTKRNSNFFIQYYCPYCGEIQECLMDFTLDKFHL